MNINIKTHEIFITNKCGLVNMTEEKHVYDTPSGDLIFFYPKSDRMTLNKVIGRDLEMNMPIVDAVNHESEWKITNNEELQIVLEMIFA